MVRVGPHGILRLLDDGQPEPMVLIHSLSGFLDAGSAGRLAVGYLLNVLPHETVAEFDLDLLFDYRARRPRMTFLSDHYGEIDMPTLTVSKMTDSAGSSFLLMHGPEPDFRWQAFAADTAWLAKSLEVSLVLGIHAVPWPSPHTRPVNISAHGNDPTLIADRPKFVGDIEVPAHAAGLLEVTMGEVGIPAMGFAAHVPHYLANAEHPRASVALLEAVSSQTGLLLPLSELRDQADASELEVTGQVAADPEHIEAVRMLEEQYDEFMATFMAAGDGTASSDDLADAEDLVSAVEQFLASHDGGPLDDDKGYPESNV